MADVMIAKCAEALALRKAFPQELSGLYTADEMAQASSAPDPAINSTPDAPALAIASAPAGYEDWLTDLQATADLKDERLLKAAWEGSSKAHRVHLARTDPAGWEVLKARCRRGGVPSGDAPDVLASDIR